ncbi:hypothetical protein HMPREF9120_01695 [Neisseria sp. oral taxon 020 str. F0370]|nr:hypothetical protein HMPREF9120_01695 [Neisseria sp. oral taxon 020 str. F0370]
MAARNHRTPFHFQPDKIRGQNAGQQIFHFGRLYLRKTKLKQHGKIQDRKPQTVHLSTGRFAWHF